MRYELINFYGRSVCKFVYLHPVHNMLAYVGMFMFHVCNKFHMPGYCRFIAFSVSVKQKAEDNFRNVTTLLIFDVITSIVSFLWAYTTATHDVTGERVRTAYDVTAACYHKRRTQRNVFCHTWY